ncbi:MAG: pyridoxal-phosphate dependent enzyme, partial [Bacteroidota bacterium]
MTHTPPEFVTGLQCLVCGHLYPYGNVLTCPGCGIQGILDVQYDYNAIAARLNAARLKSRSFDHWRYLELLPVSPGLSFPHLHVGWTPVYDVPCLARNLGIAKLYLKDEGRNPTNSFKDRASSIGVLKAIEFGFDTVACASTGNAASSLAGLSAAVGMKSFIFVPDRAPEPKITQLLIFGATVLKVHGTYEQAF